MACLVFLFLLFFYSASIYAQQNTVTFNGTIPELNIVTGMNRGVVDLSAYFNSSNSLTYKYKAGSNGIDGLIIEANSNGVTNIEASDLGTRSVIFIADDDIDVVESNEVRIVITRGAGGAVEKISFSPNTDSISLEEGDGQAFAVSGNKSVEWYVDDVKINNTEKTYNFDGDAGLHTVRAVVDGSEKNWNVSVLATSAPPAAQQEAEAEEKSPVCGNDIREAGENCSNCPSDVKCSSNTECINGVCAPVKQQGRLILWLVLLAAVIVFVVMGIILIRKKGVGAGFFERIKALFKGKKKELTGVTGRIEEERIEKIDEVDLNPLVIYFRDNLGKYEKEALINQTLQQGWTREQIDTALSRIEGLGGGNDEAGNDKNPVEKKP